MTRSILIRAAAVAGALLVAHVAKATPPAAAHRDAAAKLFAAGHATAAELDAATEAAAIEAAALAAAELWAAAGVDDVDGEVRRVTDLLRLPSGGDSADALPAGFAARAAGVLRMEAAALPVEAVAERSQNAAEVADRIAGLAAEGIATGDERSRAEAGATRVRSSLADLRRRRDGLLSAADSVSTVTADHPQRLNDAELLTPLRETTPRNRTAAAAALASLLDARVDAAAASAAAVSATNHEARVRKTDERFRRPRELTDAESETRIQELLAESAVLRVAAAEAAYVLACDAPAGVGGFDWSEVMRTAAATRPASIVPPLPEPAESVARPMTHTTLRPITDGFAPWTTERQRRDQRTDRPTYDRLTQGPVRFGVSPPLAWPRAFEPGWTYSSGYAFGQKRWDLPRRYRYPRADGYGGPWYLPGSPTNRLRYQFPRYPSKSPRPRD